MNEEAGIAVPFNVTFAEGSDFAMRKKLFVFTRPGVVIYFLPQADVGYICWYRLSELLGLGQPIEILLLPEYTAILLQEPVEVEIDRIREPVRSTPLLFMV